MTQRARILLLSSVSLVIAVGSAGAGTIHVPMDQPTLQAGIDAASAGDTVLVAPGTYSGMGNRNLDFGGVNLVLLGDGFPDEVIIDCDSEFDGLANGFLFQNGETAGAIVQGFTVRNCWAPQHVTYANSGGGMLLIDASPTLLEIDFVDNQANGGSGAGIACVGTSNPAIDNCGFTGNYTNNYGSAVYLATGADAVIDNCRMWNNGGNGAIAGSNTTPLIVDCAIGGNYGIDSRGGAALRFWSASDVTVLGCLITGNKANTTSRGGSALLLLDTAVAHIQECTLAGNTSGDVGGGILMASGSNASVFLNHSILWGNCAENGGDQLFRDSATGTVDVQCSDVDSSGVAAAGVTYDPDTIFDDPLFCDPWDCSLTPSFNGDYTVAMNSPALAANNACGMLMGVLGMGCGDITPVRRTTWGNLKTLYQDQ